MQSSLKILSVLANSVEPAQTAPIGVWSWFSLFAYAILLDPLVFKFLDIYCRYDHWPMVTASFVHNQMHNVQRSFYTEETLTQYPFGGSSVFMYNCNTFWMTLMARLIWDGVFFTQKWLRKFRPIQKNNMCHICILAKSNGATWSWKIPIIEACRKR